MARKLEARIQLVHNCTIFLCSLDVRNICNAEVSLYLLTKPAVFLTLFKRWGGASLKEWVRMVKEDYKENIWSVREKGKGEERNMVGLSKKGRRRKTMEE